jgi:uncharacterized membrane protein
MKKLIATVATAGLLVVGGAGAAYAADTGGSSTPTRPAAGAARLRPGVRRGLRHAVLKVSADTIGVSVQDLRQGLRSGQSIADVAHSKNVDPQKVVDAIVKAGDTKIESLVTSGKITSERGQKLEARLPDLAQRVVNRVPKQHAAPGAGGSTGATGSSSTS